MHTRIKICGLTRPDDAVAAAELGVDAIGVVFVANSPRVVTLDRAREIRAVLPPFLSLVALFVDADKKFVTEVISELNPDLLQFHGQESAQFCNQFGAPYIKAVSVRTGVDVDGLAHKYHRARALLLDSFHPAKAGGTGQTFDWALVPPAPNMPIVLAGGLTPENVGAAVQQVRPAAVDVSGGVELDKGVKDRAKMAAFVAAVRRVDASRS